MMLDAAIRAILTAEFERIRTERDKAWIEDAFEAWKTKDPVVFNEIVRYLTTEKIYVGDAYDRAQHEWPAIFMDRSECKFQIETESIGDSRTYEQVPDAPMQGRMLMRYLMRYPGFKVACCSINWDQLQYLWLATGFVILSNVVALNREYGFSRLEVQGLPATLKWGDSGALVQFISVNAVFESQIGVRMGTYDIDSFTVSGECSRVQAPPQGTADRWREV